MNYIERAKAYMGGKPYDNDERAEVARILIKAYDEMLAGNSLLNVNSEQIGFIHEIFNLADKDVCLGALIADEMMVFG